MRAMTSQITSLTIVYSSFFQAQIKENIKALHHWLLCGEFTVDRWIPRTKASNAENVSIWWRHHAHSVPFIHSEFKIRHARGTIINHVPRHLSRPLYFAPCSNCSQSHSKNPCTLWSKVIIGHNTCVTCVLKTINCWCVYFNDLSWYAYGKWEKETHCKIYFDLNNTAWSKCIFHMCTLITRQLCFSYLKLHLSRWYCHR